MNININKGQWVVYMLQCNDESLYTGITNDLKRRLNEHNDNSVKSKAARYTRARQPVVLKYYECYNDRTEASSREYAIKKLTKAKKLRLIRTSALLI